MCQNIHKLDVQGEKTHIIVREVECCVGLAVIKVRDQDQGRGREPKTTPWEILLVSHHWSECVCACVHMRVYRPLASRSIGPGSSASCPHLFYLKCARTPPGRAGVPECWLIAHQSFAFSRQGAFNPLIVSGHTL